MIHGILEVLVILRRKEMAIITAKEFVGHKFSIQTIWLMIRRFLEVFVLLGILPILTDYKDIREHIVITLDLKKLLLIIEKGTYLKAVLQNKVTPITSK